MAVCRPTPVPITDPATARALTGAYIPNQTLPYSETWTAGVQHIFANKYTLEVRYVGTRGIHLPVQTRLNRTSPVTRDTSTCRRICPHRSQATARFAASTRSACPP